MPPAERARDRGQRNARLVINDLATELREARLAAGLSQAGVAKAAGLSQSQVSRTERERPASVRIDVLAHHAAAVGLRLTARLYPHGSPVRDAGQLRLIARLRAEVPASLVHRTEVPVAGPGDLRAWDLVVGDSRAGWLVGVDAETRLRDVQATQRRCELKWRDSRVDRIILLVSDTEHNRRVLREHREALASTFPAATGEVLRALRRGQLPGRNGIVVL
jgi:transcriptional regulator with XRE-family HTH domain